MRFPKQHCIFPLSSHLIETFVFLSDARERFHYIILILIIAIRNLTEFNWNLGKIFSLLFYKVNLLNYSDEYYST